MTSNDYARLMGHLFPGDEDEHGAVLLAGIVEGDRGLRLTVRHVVPAQDGVDYVAGEHGYRALHPAFIHRQIIACRDQRLAYLAVHNHDCDDRVGFSRVDMASHERGYPALRDIGKGVPVGALVFGRRSAEADIWMPDGTRRTLAELRVIGPTIRRIFPQPRRETAAHATLDRQVRMFGSAGQSLLKESRIAVVGLGGVGSLVSEYLGRLGVGDLILIDPDVVEDTNLSRVVGATGVDAEASLFKTQIALRHLRETSSARILCITGDVALRSIAARLTQCDYIFLAADSMRARLVANALSHQYLIPMVQLGAKVRPNDGEISDAMSAVRQVRPGHACLWCNGLIDSTELAKESKSDEERKQQAYGVEEPNPSVITLNAVAAAHGVNDFLFDFLDLRPRVGEDWYRHFHFISDRLARVAPRKDAQCRECVRRLGMGDGMQLPCVDA
jgi:hypothetical protein